MMNSTIQNLETNENLETVLNLLSQIAPIQQLQDLWNERPFPTHTEVDILQLCSKHYADELNNSITDRLQGRSTFRMDPEFWIVKNNHRWHGWNPETSSYFVQPILFEGDINFSKNFEPLIVCDKESGSINWIWTIKNFIKWGGAMMLSDNNWISLFLTLAKTHMPNDFPRVARFSDDLESLFNTLVASINGDLEIAKLRTAMGKLCRKPGEMVQSVLYKLKSQYEMLLGIQFPSLPIETVSLRADNYSSNCAQYFVSSNTAKMVQQYICYKIQKGDTNSVMKISKIITNHESFNSADRIQTTCYLPEQATRLDSSMFNRSNIEELIVASAQVGMQPGGGRGWSPRRPPSQTRSSAKSPTISS